MIPWPQKATTSLEQHHANLDAADLLPQTPQKTSEINGERQAAKHMSGEQDTFLCHCNTVDVSVLDMNRDEQDYYQGICSECGYEAPIREDWKMVKGWSGGGPGLDQVWIQPTNWNWEDPDNPPLEKVRIVEAKGGNANLDTDGTYHGYYGPDGLAIDEDGVLQMSAEWVYINCDTDANVAHLASEYKAVAEAVRDSLAGKIEGIEISGIVIRDGKPLRRKELPPEHYDLVAKDGIFIYDEPEEDRVNTLRDELTEVITLLGPDSPEVADVCGQIVDHVKGTKFDKAYIKKYKEAVRAVAQLFSAKNVITPSEQVLKSHFINVLAQIDQLIERIPGLIETHFTKIFPNPNSHLATPPRLLRAREQAEKNAFSQLYKSLNEVSGEVDAAKFMHARGAQMVRGWSGGDTGIDQVWVQSNSSPNFNINVSPWPNDFKILIVEAKGGSSGLSKGKVYKNVTLSTGVTMHNGCQQMDSNWVLHHADDLMTLAEKAPGDHAIGAFIKQGILTGNPPVRGIGVKGGTAMDEDDFEHLATTNVIDGDVTGFTGVDLIKYGP